MHATLLEYQAIPYLRKEYIMPSTVWSLGANIQATTASIDQRQPGSLYSKVCTVCAQGLVGATTFSDCGVDGPHLWGMRASTGIVLRH